MRVAVNLLGLPSLGQGGAGLYAGTLLRGLSARADVNLTVLCDERMAGELEGLAADVRAVSRRPRAAPLAAADLVLAGRDPCRFSDGYGRVSRSLLAACELVHYPLSFMGPPRHEAPSVVTSVDVQHRALPSNFSRADRLLRRIRWDRSLAAADRVIAISRFTASTLERHGLAGGVPVDVVPLACHERFFEPLARPVEGRRRYVLYPASPLPAKNHHRLLGALASLDARYAELRLVLCGPVLHDWAPVRARIAELGLEDRVTVEGNVGLDRLRALYAGATGLIFPSLYEGFGLPLVEAMASGCPLAASTSSSIPEVLDGHGLLFDPLDEAAIARALATLADLPRPERERAAQEGRRRAEAFKPDCMVERTMAVYDRALREPARRRAGTPPGAC